MMTIRIGLVLGLAFVLQACVADQPVGLIVPVHGEAVRANIAVQTVNPMAPMDRGPLFANGERAAIQQERYLGDMVEAPETVGTQQGLGGGGSGGGGGAAGGGAAGAVGAAAP